MSTFAHLALSLSQHVAQDAIEHAGQELDTIGRLW